jgi:hypothetical protein
VVITAFFAFDGPLIKRVNVYCDGRADRYFTCHADGAGQRFAAPGHTRSRGGRPHVTPFGSATPGTGLTALSSDRRSEDKLALGEQ